MLTILGGKKLLVAVCLFGLLAGTMQADGGDGNEQSKEKELTSLRWYTYGSGAACALATVLFVGTVLCDWFGVNSRRIYPHHSILTGAIAYGGGLGCGAVGVWNGAFLVVHEKATMADKIASNIVIANGVVWWALIVGGGLFA